MQDPLQPPSAANPSARTSPPPVGYPVLSITTPAGTSPLACPLRTDPSKQASAQEHLVAELFKEAKEYGIQRAHLIVEAFFNRVAHGGPENDQSLKIKELDTQFSTKLSENRTVFVGQTEAREELIRIARVAQDKAVYKALSSRFFELGKEYGETQGRKIDEASYQEARQKIDSLGRAITHNFSSLEMQGRALPQGVTLSGLPPEELLPNTLHAALLAAARLGERTGIDRRVNAEVDAAHIYRTIAGWKEYLPTWFPLFKPFAEVHAVLQAKSAEQLQFIDESMRERRGVSLEDALKHAYGKTHVNRIRWLLEGDNLGSLAMHASRTLGSWFSTQNSRGDALRELYEQVSSRDMRRFERLIAKELGIDPDHDLPKYLKKRLSSEGIAKLEALRRGDLTGERVIHIHDLIHSRAGRQLELRRIFRRMKPDELAEFCGRYKSKYGTELRDDIDKKMRPSAAKDLCLAVLDRDSERTSAAAIRCAFEYRADFIGGPFLKTTKEQRQEMIHVYERIYHGGKSEFDHDLRNAARREDFVLAKVPYLGVLLEKLSWPGTTSYTFLKSIVENGELSPAELLRYFMAGIGTDIQGIYAVLEGRTPEEIKAIEEDYARRYPPTLRVKLMSKIPLVRELILTGDLRHDLSVELSGDHEFDILQFMEGLPDERNERIMCQTLLERLRARYDHERSGPLMRVRRGLLSTLRGDGRIVNQFEEDFKRANEYYTKHIKNQASPSAHHIKRFSTLVRLAEVQADAYREAKVAISDLVLNSGAFIGATFGAAAVVMVSALPWWMGPISSGAGSLGWRWLQGRLVLGRGFGKTDATFQAMRAFVDGASLFTIRAGVATLSELLGRQLSGAATKGSFKTSMHRFVKTVEELIKHQNKARHVLERGEALASDAELAGIRKEFSAQIEETSEALNSAALTDRVTIESVIQGALQ